MLKNIPPFLLLIFTIVTVSTVPSMVHAATNPYGDRDMENIDIENAYRTPLVYVMTITGATLKNGYISGQAEIMNADAFGAADLGYRIEIVGTEVNDFGESLFTFWRGPREDIGSLAPQEKRVLSFSIAAPVLPKGGYLVRVQIITSQGRPYGWGDAPLLINGGTGITLKSSGIIIKQYGTGSLDPLSGPNIDPETPMTITVEITNITEDRTVLPVLHFFDFDFIRQKGEETQFKAVDLKKGEKKNLSYVISSRKEPGVTAATLMLIDAENKHQLSPLADFRWVIRGESAHVMAIRPQNIGKKAGDILKFRIDMVGAPDAETTVNGMITLSIIDDAGVVATLQKPFIDLKDGILSGDAQLPLTRALSLHPRIVSELKNTDQTMLHSYTVPLLFSENGQEILSTVVKSSFEWSDWSQNILIGVAVSLLILLGSILLYFKIYLKRK